MRLLDRYVVRELVVPLSYCLVGFLIFWVTFDLFGDLDSFQKEKLTAGDIAEYYLVKTPELLVTVLPVAFLLSLLYALTNHGRHNELIAMRAAGLSLFRISLPYLAIGLALTGVLFFLNEYLAPDSTQRAQEIRDRRLIAQDQSKVWKTGVNFRNARDNRIWNIAHYNTKTFQMVEPHVEWTLEDGTRKQLIAKQGIRTNGVWLFQDVELFTYEPNPDLDRPAPRPLRTNLFTLPELTETPEQIELQMKFNQLNAYAASKRPQLSLSEIAYLRSHLELNARDDAMLETQYHARLAQPWVCFVVALIALPFGARSSSRRNVMVGVASSIFICFAYFILLRFGLALGTGGVVPPWVAAWLPNLIFALLGICLTLRVK